MSEEALRARVAELEAALEAIGAHGIVYVKPGGWNSAKAGGGPTLDDCEELDLGVITAEALEP